MADRFKGIEYPVFANAKGYFHETTDTDQIKSDILQLLLTRPGERVMLPEFGTPLNDLVFDPNDALIAEKARAMIINSLSLFEPRAVITNIEVSLMPEDRLNTDDDLSEVEHILYINIEFVDPNQIESVQELSLQLPLST